MRIEEIIREFKIRSEKGRSHKAVYEYEKGKKITIFFNEPPIYLLTLKKLLDNFFDKCSMGEREVVLKEIKKSSSSKHIKYEDYELDDVRLNYLPFNEIVLILLQEFYIRASLKQSHRKELYKKNMKEVKDFSLVNKNYRNDFLCFLGEKFFPNYEKSQNLYESLPGSLRKDFFSDFIFTNKYLRNDLRNDYKNFSR